MRRLVATLFAGCLLMSACSSGGDNTKPSLPLPDKPPSARGPATGPPLEAKVLLAAADDLESTLGNVDEGFAERRAGAFISGTTAVGYSVDDISGYDLDSGEELWTSKLDLGGGSVCFASQPRSDVEQFTVVYGKGGYCGAIATIKVADGSVLSDVDTLDLEATLDGDEVRAGPISHLFTVDTTDYLIDNSGVVWSLKAPKSDDDKKKSKSTWKAATKLRHGSYFDLYPTPDGKRLIGSHTGSECSIDAYALPSFEPLWTKAHDDLIPQPTNDCVIALAAGNPAWMTEQIGTMHHVIQVDPKTGEVLGHVATDSQDKTEPAKDTLDADVASLYFDATLGLDDGDMIFAQARGISRYSLADEKMDWSLDLTQLEMESDQKFPTTTVLPQGLTEDGYLVAIVSNNTAAEMVAVEAETGTLVGRWAIPPEYRNGFQVEPHLTLFDDGVVLTRNFEAWKYAFDGPEEQEPEGDRFDIGVFTFPDPDADRSDAVPTAGPVDTDASWLGGLEKAAGDDVNLTAQSVGDRLLVDTGSAVVALNPKTGKKSWSATLPGGGQLCDWSEPAGDAKVVTVIFKTGDDDADCRSLVRIGLKKGTLGDVVEAPAGEEFFSVHAYDGQEFVVSSSGRVDQVTAKGLDDVGASVRKDSYLRPTPEDSDLLIGSAELDGGKDWAIDAYRLPSFEKVWSTTASKALGGVDERNYMSIFYINPLWISTEFGDTSDYNAKVDEILAHLDPKTGDVTTTTGKVRRDYSADDPQTLSIGSAATSSISGVGLDDGSIIVSQPKAVMRYSVDGEVVWSTDVSSIRNSMEREESDQVVQDDYDLIDGGKTLMVTMSNGTSLEFMTMKTSDGTITGRWNAPAKYRNGLQTWPDALAVKGGVAVLHTTYGWNQRFGPDSGRQPPSGQQYDLGLFALDRQD